METYITEYNGMEYEHDTLDAACEHARVWLSEIVEGALGDVADFDENPCIDIGFRRGDDDTDWIEQIEYEFDGTEVTPSAPDDTIKIMLYAQHTLQGGQVAPEDSEGDDFTAYEFDDARDAMQWVGDVRRAVRKEGLRANGMFRLKVARAIFNEVKDYHMVTA